jgi:hypothetical protein
MASYITFNPPLDGSPLGSNITTLGDPTAKGRTAGDIGHIVSFGP